MSLPSKCIWSVLVILAAAPAHADALLAPRILGTTTITRTAETVETVGFGTIDVSDARFGFAELIMSGNPMPFIQASATGVPDPLNTSVVRAVGQIEYFLSLVGPAGQVPVVVTASGSASATTGVGASYFLESSWALLGTGVNVGGGIRTGQQTGAFSDGFAQALTVLLSTNETYRVVMRADASVGVNDAATGDAFATVDPTFALGTGVDPQLYSFTFSPGIGNTRPVGSVPEPATGVLLGSGALAATALRRWLPRARG